MEGLQRRSRLTKKREMHPVPVADLDTRTDKGSRMVFTVNDGVHEVCALAIRYGSANPISRAPTRSRVREAVTDAGLPSRSPRLRGLASL